MGFGNVGADDRAKYGSDEARGGEERQTESPEYWITNIIQ